MSAHFHAVVWIDHREAKIFHFSASEADRVVVHPHNPTQHIHHKANTIGSGHAAEDQKFYDEVAKAITDAGSILIVGPGIAKTALVAHIEVRMPQLRAKISAIETVDHPTDGEIVALARKHFKFDHQMPQRTL